MGEGRGPHPLFLPTALGPLSRRRTLIAFAVGLMCFAAIVLSGERMALIFAIGSIGLSGLFVRQLRRAAIVVIPLGALFTSGVFYFNPALYDRQVTSTLAVVGNIADSPYGVIWRSAAEISEDHPVFGVGMHNFRLVCPDQQYGPLTVGAGNYPRCSTHPHHIYLQWLVECGALGLTAFLASMFLLLRELVSHRSSGRGDDIFTALLVTIMMRLRPVAPSTSFFVAWAAIPFWLCVGWALSYCREDLRPRS